MKKILGVMFALLPLLGWGQDAAKWDKARDYLSCRLSLEAIRGKVRTDSSIRGRFARVEPVLVSATIEAPPSPAALDGTLRDFARVREVVVEPLSRVDLRAFAASPDGVRRLVDTAFAIAGRGYVIDERTKAGLRAAVGSFLAAGVATRADTAPKTVAAPAKKPVIALGGQPDGQVAAAGSRGARFDLWVLLPIVLLGLVCLVLRRKYLEIKDELKARKVEMRSFNENYFGAGRAGSGGGSGGGAKPLGPDRREIERAIANSNVLAELNDAIGKLQLRVSQLEGKGAVTSSTAGGSAASAISAPGMPMREKNKLKVVEAEKARPVDGADVFYMAGPVNNYFPNSAKSFTKDNTVYRFKVSANRQDAEFELHTSGAPINEIVQLAESYIKAACDEENLPSYPVKNIITKKAGQAILDGDKWIIKSKALIRYE
jgi:hypothetical protein